ncbi:PAQR family membrane homeostasis protein TrhA [Flavicella sediminum]|uniref:PAQR family membrane homeostasis protein TrhA n=1 Tax=Flavicella sediminum TaxID=2585141 RepID=UPI001121E628|nr:hemolysin III family protein [Flavicella sediminum]
MEFKVKYYPEKEERWNVISHGLGVLLSLIAFPFLISKALQYEDPLVMLSFIIYGLSMIILYVASTLYHSAKNRKIRYYLNIFDHAAIYVLIAGTYAPVALVVLQGKIGWLIFGFSWVLAIIGVFYKIFFIGKYKTISVITYVAMGWMVIFALRSLLENFSSEGLRFLLLGGIFYSLGALFFALPKLAYNHAIFHFLVLFGSISHFIAIYCFALV